MSIVIFWVINILTLGIGIFIGSRIGKEEVDEVTEKAVNKVKNKTVNRDIGPIKRPSAKELRKKGTKLEETEQEMAKTFSKILNRGGKNHE